MFFAFYFKANSQEILPNYKGGVNEFYNDIDLNIEVSESIALERKCHLSQQLIYINKSGKLDSINSYNGHINKYDSIVINIIESKKGNWIKTKASKTIFVSVWFFNLEAENFVLDALPSFTILKKTVKTSDNNVLVLKPIECLFKPTLKCRPPYLNINPK